MWNFFIEGVGSFDMHRSPEITTSIAQKYSFLKISSPYALNKIIGKSANTAPAGAGTPVKNFPESGVLMFSMS